MVPQDGAQTLGWSLSGDTLWVVSKMCSRMVLKQGCTSDSPQDLRWSPRPQGGPQDARMVAKAPQMVSMPRDGPQNLGLSPRAWGGP